MIYDCFTFFNELDMLEIRLSCHDAFVDRFVLVEGDRTFAGKPIESCYLANKERFALWADKITHLIAPMDPDPPSRWKNEESQRAYHMNALQDAAPNDLILVGCVDEIYNPWAIEAINNSPTPAFLLVLQSYWYYLNGKDVGYNGRYPCPVTARRSFLNDKDTNDLWQMRYQLPQVQGAGWHFSWLGGAEDIITKIESFAHSEYDYEGSPYKDLGHIEDHVASGKDLFDRWDHVYQYVPIDDSFPKYIVDNQDKYAHLIKQV